MSDPTLPGLEPPAPRDDTHELPIAVDRTLTALEDDGFLDEHRDAARRELARTVSRIIARKELTGRASTVGNDARVLMDLLDGMVPATAAGVDERLTQAMDEWSRHVEQLEQLERERAGVPGSAE
jgi:uncharacterized protein YciW